MAEKIDLKRTLPSYHARVGQFDLVDVPRMQYLALDGHGDPNTSPLYTATLASLYTVAYALKFLSKTERDRDYVVPPLEGLWWADDMDSFTDARDKTQWDWTMLIAVPDWLDESDVAVAVERVARKSAPPRIADVTFRELREGLCVQTLHVGSFDDEAPVLQRLHHEVIPARGLRRAGTHHEIYFSDARRVAPERMRTLLRQPVVRGEMLTDADRRT